MPQRSSAEIVEGYVQRCRRALWGISAARREEFLRDLRADLLDEMDSAADMAEPSRLPDLLARRDPPERLARALRTEIYQGHLHRLLLALIPAVAVFAWILLAQTQVQTDPDMLVSSNVIAIQAGGALGLIVAQFLVRRLWARHGEPIRLLLGTSFGFLVGCLVHWAAWGAFLVADGLPWAYIGFAVERMVARRHWGIALVDALGYAALVTLVHWAYQFLPPSAPAPGPGVGELELVVLRPSLQVFPVNRMCLGLGTQMFLWAAFRITVLVQRRRATTLP